METNQSILIAEHFYTTINNFMICSLVVALIYQISAIAFEVIHLKNLTKNHVDGSNMEKAYFLMSLVSNNAGLPIVKKDSPGETFTFRGEPKFDFYYLLLFPIFPVSFSLFIHFISYDIVDLNYVWFCFYLFLFILMISKVPTLIQLISRLLLVNYYSTGSIFKSYNTKTIKYKL